MRVRLHGKAKTEQRMKLFTRSKGHCEAQVPYRKFWFNGEIDYGRCNARITWQSFHWSHNRHGANKCDCLECGIASCETCHLVGVHNPKPCPRKQVP